MVQKEKGSKLEKNHFRFRFDFFTYLLSNLHVIDKNYVCVKKFMNWLKRGAENKFLFPNLNMYEPQIHFVSCTIRT